MTLGESLGQKGILNDPDSAKQGHVTTIFIQKSSGDFFESFRNVPCCVCLACCILALVALVAIRHMCKKHPSLHRCHRCKSPTSSSSQAQLLVFFGCFWLTGKPRTTTSQRPRSSQDFWIQTTCSLSHSDTTSG